MVMSAKEKKAFVERMKKGKKDAAKGKKKKVRTSATYIRDTKTFLINNFQAGKFEVYLDWTTPSELGIYVDRPQASGRNDPFASVIIDLATGKTTSRK